MSLHRSTLALLAGVVALAGCSDPSGPGDPPESIDALPRALSTAEQKVVAAGNDFSFSLFRQANTAGARDSNVFISPLSASMALGMTMNGAAGTTFTAMRAALAFGTATQDEINDGYKNLIALLRGLDKSTDFRIANSVWYRRDFPFEQPFLTTTKSYFDAQVTGLDFNDASGSLTTINGWVDKSTNSKIKKIIDEIRADDVMFLINAIYFKGTWRRAFDPKETRDDQFRPQSGGTQAMRLMHLKDTVPYLETAQFQAVDLPYGNNAYAMTVMLPKAGTDVNALVASLTPSAWAGWTGQFHTTEVDLSLPKFKLEYERKLNDDLKALGMGVAFSAGGADFTRMSSRGRDLYIAFVKQKTYVDVYEEGTEAAAVTAVGVRVTSAPPPAPVMRVDRPFVFAIRERLTGSILFIGKIVRMP